MVKDQIFVPIVNPEVAMKAEAPVIRKYIAGIQGGRPVTVYLSGSQYVELHNDIVPAGTPVYRVENEYGGIWYEVGKKHKNTNSNLYENKFAALNFVGVLAESLILDYDKIITGSVFYAIVPAAIMTEGIVNITATGWDVALYEELLAAPYQGIKFEKDEVANSYSQSE